MATATREAAQHAREQLREKNLSDAHRATAELLGMFRQGAESQTQLNDAKRMIAERVRREAGIDVVRGARRKVMAERAKSASGVRNRSERDALDAEAGRTSSVSSHRASASRIELTASPARVRQLKNAEAERKANLTDGLRRQNRALEALALERRSEEMACRQRMHDAIMCARYGVASEPLQSIRAHVRQ